ncbi:UbiA family prenyltransferase [Bradyrhizobium sp. LHD-71]|uniref:UbiA family prenyltransferase n=1 Tax=Bradyrhizobium sp. LHD-71 TaxID=3072141 RepID=UPI00280DD350|nr:UbiA family prenyltransferase [Bradyrhizobium sp. LHD-71]MDQ8728044.1 UbiA family prenyltransferase [Bradyrhizobium sp. LHD-71]
MLTRSTDIPLYVDFDRTLCKTDSLYECFVAVLKARPLSLLGIFPRLMSSRAAFKAALWRLAADIVDISHFPREPTVLNLVAQARHDGRRVALVSAADAEMLRSDPSLAAIFDEIIGSDGSTNLKGNTKAAALKERSPYGFEYVGDSSADIPVFEAAQRGYGVGLSSSTAGALAARGISVEQLVPPSDCVRALIKSFRLHQWFKNVLIFIPPALTVGSLGINDIVGVTIGFFLMGVLASGTYLVNDLFDLQADRRHPRKAKRPLASGRLPISWALVAAPAMILFALVGGYLLSPAFAGTLGLYVVLTLGYSFRLKRTALLDVLVIGLLFTLRVVAGMALISAPSSQWLLIFSVFFFTGLALMKRDAEIALRVGAQQQALQGRGYNVDDRFFIQVAGIATSIASLVIFALFIVAIFENSRQYSSPYFLWAAYFLLAYWMLRLWFICFRGQMNDDPIEFAVKDPTSMGIFLGIGAVCVLAQLL